MSLTEQILHEHEPHTDPDPRAEGRWPCPAQPAGLPCRGELQSRLEEHGARGRLLVAECSCCDYRWVL